MTDIIDRLRGPAPSILAMRDAAADHIAQQAARIRGLERDLDEYVKRCDALETEITDLRSRVDVMHAGSLRHHAQIQALRGVVVDLLGYAAPFTAASRDAAQKILEEIDRER